MKKGKMCSLSVICQRVNVSASEYRGMSTAKVPPETDFRYHYPEIFHQDI